MRIASFVLFFASAIAQGQTQSDAVTAAVAAIHIGKLPEAEQILRRYLEAQPKDATALGVLAVVLDQEKRLPEAETAYGRALEISPRDPALLNNYGNHLITAGRWKEAREAFQKALAANSSQVNALMQLARIALEQKAPAEALTLLDRLPADAQKTPGASVLRLQTLYMLQRDHEADALLTQLQQAARDDRSVFFRLGVALSAANRYDAAESSFAEITAAEPANFDALYGLGLAASHAGHNEKAREAFESARRLQPDNATLLYDLAVVEIKLNNKERALELVAQAVRIAPERADAAQLLARTTADLGYFGDAARAWDAYLKLAPEDDTGRRERGFAETATGENTARGLEDLRWFAKRHPADAVGRYELGVAEAALNHPDDAKRELNQAIALDPHITGARVARGLLLYREGTPDAALPDFEAAAQREPENAAVLDRLGQCYLALDRKRDALPPLRKASTLAPDDSRVQLHFARALRAAGLAAEADQAFAQLRALGPDRSTLPQGAGLLSFLALSPEEQAAKYRAGVERTVQKDPANAEALVRYLEILLSEGNRAEAQRIARQLAGTKASSALLAEASRALLTSKEYGTARELIASSGDPKGELRLDNAIATAHIDGAERGLAELNQVPQAERGADYELAVATMLSASGKTEAADAAIARAIALHPTRPDLLEGAALLLIRRERASELLRLLDATADPLRNAPQTSVLRAIALEAQGRTAESERTLSATEARFPDWISALVAHATVLNRHARYQESAPLIETAMKLGANSPAAWSALAQCKFKINGQHSTEGEAALQRARELAPDDTNLSSASTLERLFR